MLTPDWGIPGAGLSAEAGKAFLRTEPRRRVVQVPALHKTIYHLRIVLLCVSTAVIGHWGGSYLERGGTITSIIELNE